MTVIARSFDLADGNARYGTRSLLIDRAPASRYRSEDDTTVAAVPEDDTLRPARGLVIGLMLAVPFWLVLLGLLFWH